MTTAEKRALECYLILILQHIRKDNTYALHDIKNFIKSTTFMKNYDAEFLYNTILENLEILDKIPSHMELVLTLSIESDTLKFTKHNYKYFYNRTLTSQQTRQAQFTYNKITLYPKIKKQNFHQHLLTFFKNFSIIGTKLPIKWGYYAHKRNGHTLSIFK